ncbi:hypothetical protein HpBT0082_05130 [Helicobacter pylori]
MIEKLQKTIAITIDREIDPTIKEIRDKLPETYSNLDRSRDKFVSKLKNSIFDEIDQFQSDFRREMYERIDRGIKDKRCEKIYDNKCKQGMKELDRTIEGLVKKCEEQFRKDLQKDAKQFEDEIKNFLERLNRINIDHDFDHDSSINTDKGIKKKGLFTSIISLIIGLFNFSNPVGWGSIGLGLTGIGKSVWSWFSSDYEKSQQRKEVDKNLDKVCGIIEEKVRNKIEDAKKGICEKVESLKARLNDSVVCYERMREGLIKAGEGLWQIDNNIKTRIAQ